MTDEPDDETRVARRRGTGPDAHPEDDLEATRLVARRGAEAAAPVDPGEAGADTDLDDATRLSRRAARAEAEIAGPRRTTAGDLPEVDPDEGSTVVVRRESRRRADLAAAGHEAIEDTVLTRGHGPSVPGGAVRSVPRREETAPAVTYGPRAAEPARVTRAAAPVRSPQQPVDTDSLTARRRRLARRRLVGTIVVAGFVALAAAVTLGVILLAGAG